jgi:hypothetical protein
MILYLSLELFMLVLDDDVNGVDNSYRINIKLLPGMYPKIVSRMLMQRSTVHPTSKKTPNGGSITAAMSLQMSRQVTGILRLLEESTNDDFIAL